MEPNSDAAHPQGEFPLLEGIAQPSDLHKLDVKQLKEVAAEVRRAILEKVSQTGGHFSSNLGTVELTVAMYAAYSLPPDKVVWDTGHQAYPHKLLTGRLNRFDTLRKHRGLRGFLSRDEHELDAFGAGHAGTAVSAALGFALARDRMQETYRVAAVAGDASIVSGMSWEALNHAGELDTQLTVVLNDNRMSIAPNVGALHNYLAKLRSRPQLQDIAYRAKSLAEKMPDPITRVAAGLRHGITHYLAPEETGTIFEEMGFEYIGPLDGHDLETMLEVFRNVRDLKRPVFVHALTVKGKGYEVAESDATKWHGVIPFDLDRCEMVKVAGPQTYTQAFGSAVMDLAEKDSKVVAITAAMPDGTGLIPFSKKYPERYYDTGIAEQHAVTLAAGMAAAGLKPFCAIYSTFLQRAFDQVLHDVALQRLPVRFCLDRAGLVGDDGPTHHGAFDLSYLGLIPGIVLMAPRDTTELQEMMSFMAGYDSGPTVVRYPRGTDEGRVPERRTPIELGKAEILRKGTDVAFVAIGSMVGAAWDAAEHLAEKGIHATVVNARFAKPIDVATIRAVVESHPMTFVLEENALVGGFGQQVLMAMPEFAGKLRLKGLPDAFVEHGAQGILRSECGLDALSIADEAEATLQGLKKN